MAGPEGDPGEARSRSRRNRLEASSRGPIPAARTCVRGGLDRIEEAPLECDRTNPRRWLGSSSHRNLGRLIRADAGFPGQTRCAHHGDREIEPGDRGLRLEVSEAVGLRILRRYELRLRSRHRVERMCGPDVGKEGDAGTRWGRPSPSQASVRSSPQGYRGGGLEMPSRPRRPAAQGHGHDAGSPATSFPDLEARRRDVGVSCWRVNAPSSWPPLEGDSRSRSERIAPEAEPSAAPKRLAR